MSFKKTAISEKIQPLTVEEIPDARKVADQPQAAPQRESSQGV